MKRFIEKHIIDSRSIFAGTVTILSGIITIIAGIPNISIKILPVFIFPLISIITTASFIRSNAHHKRYSKISQKLSLYSKSSSINFNIALGRIEKDSENFPSLIDDLKNSLDTVANHEDVQINIYLFADDSLNETDLFHAKIYNAFVDRRRINERNPDTLAISSDMHELLIKAVHPPSDEYKQYFWNEDKLLILINTKSLQDEFDVFGFVQIIFGEDISLNNTDRTIISNIAIAKIEQIGYYMYSLRSQLESMRVDTNVLMKVFLGENVEENPYFSFDFLRILHRHMGRKKKGKYE